MISDFITRSDTLSRVRVVWQLSKHISFFTFHHSTNDPYLIFSPTSSSSAVLFTGTVLLIVLHIQTAFLPLCETCEKSICVKMFSEIYMETTGISANQLIKLQHPIYFLFLFFQQLNFAMHSHTRSRSFTDSYQWNVELDRSFVRWFFRCFTSLL